MEKLIKTTNYLLLLTLFLITIAGCSDRSDHYERSVGAFKFRIHPTIEADSKSKFMHFKISLATDQVQRDLVEFLKEKSGESAQSILYYLSYRMQKDIYLEVDGIKLDNVLYHFERSFDLKNERVMTVAFEAPLKDNQTTRLVIDSQLLNSGPVKFKI
ncbi:MAG: hypothetical protein AAFQ94_16900 [Bacteroidota bacterium]